VQAEIAFNCTDDVITNYNAPAIYLSRPIYIHVFSVK